MLTATAQRILRTAKRAPWFVRERTPEVIALELRLNITEVYRALEELENAGHIELTRMLTRCA